MGFLRSFAKANVACSRVFDMLLTEAYRKDGHQYFINNMLPNARLIGGKAYDLGGGSRPFLSIEDKAKYGFSLTGLDISDTELSAAPWGTYDAIVVTDLCKYKGAEDGDVTVCQATLEHVPDMQGAIRGLASTLKPGGRAFVFAPSRNALYARLNTILPENFKNWLLLKLFDADHSEHGGFKAYYDRCTPKQILGLANEAGLMVEQQHLFWTSSYFSVLFPAHVLWRGTQGISYLLRGGEAAEAFAFVFRKKPEKDVPMKSATRSASRDQG